MLSCGYVSILDKMILKFIWKREPKETKFPEDTGPEKYLPHLMPIIIINYGH